MRSIGRKARDGKVERREMQRVHYSLFCVSASVVYLRMRDATRNALCLWGMMMMMRPKIIHSSEQSSIPEVSNNAKKITSTCLRRSNGPLKGRRRRR